MIEKGKRNKSKKERAPCETKEIHLAIG